MEICNHFAFNIYLHPKALNFVNSEKIECKCEEDLCVVDISENNPQWHELSRVLKSENIPYLSETKFDKNELFSAEWLTLRSKWNYDYPQPENEYSKFTYTEDMLCLNRDCGIELTQKDCFRFKRTPKWGKRNFCMTNWVSDELFISTKAKELLKGSDLTGFLFWEVKNKSGKENLNDIYQLKLPFVLNEGVANFTSRINGIFVCPVCGKQKIQPTGRGQYIFKKEVFANAPDFVKSAEWFGAAASAHRLILVSQKAHRFIKENKLDSSLVFEPVKLV